MAMRKTELNAFERNMVRATIETVVKLLGIGSKRGKDTWNLAYEMIKPITGIIDVESDTGRQFIDTVYGVQDTDYAMELLERCLEENLRMVRDGHGGKTGEEAEEDPLCDGHCKECHDAGCIHHQADVLTRKSEDAEANGKTEAGTVPVAYDPDNWIREWICVTGKIAKVTATMMSMLENGIKPEDDPEEYEYDRDGLLVASSRMVDMAESSLAMMHLVDDKMAKEKGE